ncbi:ABC transporter permease subunit [Bacillus sp. FJAT-50079]|uniref:ABC transporter permease n=1 Tax=Bacillus sp. FJAT-50079 TaxID=2833577 RepID=UPI001BC96935|nr:ABC transporter permease subunit [Bacillus sp. FJAT-50079]MBS4207968.1 ABC transporter permease subunit [Bacillus sp. FJAT-50079]
MNQFLILFKKERLEAVRDIKWIWMPLVFIILGIMEPLSAYYTPQIIEKFGGLPEGAIIEIPLPAAGEVLVRTAGQLNLFGVLVIVLAFMGILASERKSGTAAMVLVKPVSYYAFVLAKWLHGVVLVFCSYMLGMLAAWYYTYQLFEWVPASDFFAGSLTFGIWLIFIFTLTLFFSSCSSKSGIAAFGSLGTVIVLSMISSLLPEKFKWSPFGLTGYASEFWMGQSASGRISITMIVTVALLALLTMFSIRIFKRKELC